MSASMHAAKQAAFSSSGRFLVFAAPIVCGFHGAPHVLSADKTLRKLKRPSPRKHNWAKRRAYHS